MGYSINNNGIQNISDISQSTLNNTFTNPDIAGSSNWNVDLGEWKFNRVVILTNLLPATSSILIFPSWDGVNYIGGSMSLFVTNDGLPTTASDIPVVTEIGGVFSTYGIYELLSPVRYIIINNAGGSPLITAGKIHVIVT